MFGRKKIGDDVSPGHRQQLIEGYKGILAEIDDVIERCSWFLEEKNLANVPTEYHDRLRETLETERGLRALVARRIDTMLTGTLVVAEMAEETEVIHRSTVEADDLMRSAGSDASAQVILQALAEKGRNAQD